MNKINKPLKAYRNFNTKLNWVPNSLEKKKSNVKFKDFFIPIISAILAVFLNQFFFETNRRTEAKIEYELKQLESQTPALNRILAFTYKYEYSRVTYFEEFRGSMEIDVNSFDIKNFNFDSLVIYAKQNIDSINITIPSFVIDESKRKKLNEDIEIIEKQRDLLNHNIYIAVENIIEFINENRLPDLENDEEIKKSIWKTEKIQNKWESLILELRIICLNEIDSFSSTSD